MFYMISYDTLQTRSSFLRKFLDFLSFSLETPLEDPLFQQKNTRDIHFLGIALEKTTRYILENRGSGAGYIQTLKEQLDLEYEYCSLLERLSISPEKFSLVSDEFSLFAESVLRIHTDLTVEIESLPRDVVFSKVEADFISPAEFRVLLMGEQV